MLYLFICQSVNVTNKLWQHIVVVFWLSIEILIYTSNTMGMNQLNTRSVIITAVKHIEDLLVSVVLTILRQLTL
jgi:hypothetical protein